ncbi:MAG: hypothetical protein ABIJ52_00560 [Pseudomonadota bacterium]|nr:hypothetical protein [Planctomycetota bacterium]MBU2457926.1 hypothetical protein [Planctomycetota bacterium]
MRFLFFALIVLLVLPIYAEVSSLENASFSQCGINCLYLCLKYHHIDENLEDVYAAIKPDEGNNVSLKQLADFAKTKGLYVHPVVRPAFEDVKKFLTKDNSIIMQYALELPDKSKFRHIIVLVMPEQKILLLDYPKPAQEIETEKLAAVVADSEGMLVLSGQPITGFVEFFNGRSLKSLSFYAICVGFIVVGLFIVNSRKTNRAKEI